MSALITSTELDLNELFTLNVSYNFELLRNVISQLLKQGKANDGIISELKDKLEQKDKQIGQIESKLVSSIRSLSENIDEKAKEIEENQLNFFQKKDDENSKRNLATFKAEENLKELLNRIENLENQDRLNKDRIEVLEKSLEDLNKLNLKETQKKANENEKNIDEIKEQSYLVQKKIDKLEKAIENMNVKMAEINIYESIKASAEKEGGSGDVSTFIMMIEGLKKSVFQKFDFIDGKLEGNQDSINKLRIEGATHSKKIENLLSDHIEINEKVTHLEKGLFDLKVALNSLNLNNSQKRNSIKSGSLKDLSQIKDFDKNFKDLSDRVEALEEDIINLLRNMNKKDGSSTNNIHKEVSNKSLKLLNNDKTNITGNTEGDREANAIIIQLKNKITEVEKNLKIMTVKEKEKEDSMNKKINSLIEQVKSKVSIEDYAKLSDLINQLQLQIDLLKERFSGFDEKNILTEIAWLKKKVEGFSGSLQEVRNLCNKTIGHGDLKMTDTEGNLNDSHAKTNFVEISIFNEFKAKVLKDHEYVISEIEELKKLIEEIQLLLKTKASERDLKTMEDLLLTKLEEFKISCGKKYADKGETAKNFKYIDITIKQMNENNLKRMEKGENWLLAKRPFGGNSCASCEAYIGELQENREYVPWNKLKDSGERMYRLGNGFSKMLQMVNVEHDRDQNNIYKRFADDQSNLIEANHYQGNQTQNNFNRGQNSNLPKVRPKVKIINPTGQSNTQRADFKNSSMNSDIGKVQVNNNLSMEIPEFGEKDEHEVEALSTEPKM